MAKQKTYAIDAAYLIRRLSTANEHNVSLPAFQVGPYQFAYWGDDTIHVAYRTPESQVYLGRMRRDLYEPSPAFQARRDLKPLKMFAENPAQAAAAYARAQEAAICACCSRVLGRNDRERGIGAACWEAWGFDRKQKKRKV